MGSSGFSLNCQTTAIGIVFQTDIERARNDEGTAPNLRRRFVPSVILAQFSAATRHEFDEVNDETDRYYRQTE